MVSSGFPFQAGTFPGSGRGSPPAKAASATPTLLRAPTGWAPALPAVAGELNLGFTDADNREAVKRNRRLLAEAVTSHASTPLIPLRQFHSNLIVHAARADAARAPAQGRRTNDR